MTPHSCRLRRGSPHRLCPRASNIQSIPLAACVWLSRYVQAQHTCSQDCSAWCASFLVLCHARPSRGTCGCARTRRCRRGQRGGRLGGVFGGPGSARCNFVETGLKRVFQPLFSPLREPLVAPGGDRRAVRVLKHTQTIIAASTDGADLLLPKTGPT